MIRQERQGFPASILWVLVALTLGWGFNWPMIKLALSELPHWQDFAALGLVPLPLATVMLPPGSIGALVSKRR